MEERCFYHSGCHVEFSQRHDLTCHLVLSSGWSLAWINQWIRAVSMKSSSICPHSFQVRWLYHQSCTCKTLANNLSCGWCLEIKPAGSISGSCLYMIFHFLSLSAKHYDVDTTEPIACGLGTLEELLLWKRSEANPFNVAVVPLAPREPTLATCLRRTLVSHDMMGGYLDDRYECIVRAK